ncbi:glycoside hydrolase family 9 protein [uncultured Pseudoteredinibacter sp.]|uniref:glycoside hydrolase family 9 protein n=1 Tax=uncultured Pseudoteredinibacter sp. TaxID=1641701 RepID=UPI002612A23C|nr:glycoside hydrolase family 9 protein [uncultured Pseudoteredinibacter sp.]
MFRKTKIATAIGLSMLSQMASASAVHDVHFRYNLAGYSPDRPKNIVIMSDKNLSSDEQAAQWVLTRDGEQVASGAITDDMKVADKSDHHSPMQYSYHLDLRQQANVEGSYELSIEGENHEDENASFEVVVDPYGDIVAEMLVHISSRRSGMQNPIKAYRDAMRDALTYSTDSGPQLGVLNANESLSEEQKELALKPHYFDQTAALPVYKLRDVGSSHPNYIAEQGANNIAGNALWGEDSSVASFDVSGGWYDAGDYIKFTLTIAHAAYYMLRAYETNSELFNQHSLASSHYYDGYEGIIHSGAANTGRDAPIILDEAKFGLDFLARTYDLSRPDEFVVQVGDQRDHLNEDLNNEGKRLPIYDGTRHLLADSESAEQIAAKRPILSALSPSHMGLTLAALSLGAKVFEEAGYTEDANYYRAKADALYQRLFDQNTKNGQTKEGILIASAHSYETSTGTDAITDGVQKGTSCVDYSYASLETSNITNNFYNDSVYCSPELPGLYRRSDAANQKSTYDNLGLGAVEYYRLNNGQANALSNANALAQKAGVAAWASWSNVNISLHYRLAQLQQANNQFKSEIDSFRRYSDRKGSGLDSANNLFGLPQQIVWSSLGNHLIAAPYAALGALLDNSGDSSVAQIDPKSNMLYNVLDYTLGRNNWGVSMVHSESVEPEDRLEKYYNWIYTKLDLPTVGAVSQGPASKADYDSQAINGMTPVSLEEKEKRDEFNTAGSVFYEYSKNWVNMEAMGYQQAAALYTWAVASKLEAAVGDSQAGNNKPSINWQSPVDTSVMLGNSLNISVSANDADSGLESVTFRVEQGGQLLSSYSDMDTSDASFSYTWPATELGNFDLSVVATDTEGLSSSLAHSFTVTDLDIQLDLSLSSTVVEKNEQFSIAGNLTGQNADQVDSVKLFIDGLAVGDEDQTSPFEFSHAFGNAGSYSVQLRGYDSSASEIVQSVSNTVTVNDADGSSGGELPMCSALGLSLNPSDIGGIVANSYNKNGVWHRKPWSNATFYDHSAVGDLMLDGNVVYEVVSGSWVELLPSSTQYSQYWSQWAKYCQHQ